MIQLTRQPDIAHHPAAGAGRRGFTIAELMVAIGVALILMVAMAQIFASTRKTISIGQATAQLTQYGRTLERLLRNDFDSMVRQGHGYFVIRNERIGSGSDVLSRWNRRPAIYANSEEEDADEDLGTRRIDQMVFFTTGDHSTYEYRDPSFGQENIIARNDAAPVARVWWGHGMRDPLTGDGIDGIKDAIGLNGYNAIFADPRQPNGQVTPDLANRYAGQWILARQAALLMPRSTVDCDYSNTQTELNFVPSLIEIFNEFDGSYWYDTRYFFPPPYNANSPRRRLSPGYVDLVDASLNRAIAAVTEYGRLINLPTGAEEMFRDPLDALYSNLTGSQGGIDWRQDVAQSDAPESYVTDQVDRAQLSSVNEQWARQQRYRMMYSTGRIRVESAVLTADRISQMLTHASLVPGCSNFEIAWSTGQVNYPEGNLVWFDINNPANPYANHPGKTNFEVDEQTPSDARVWYLSEMLPPGAGLNSAFSTIPSNTEAARDDLYYAAFGLFVPVDNDQTRTDAWPWPKLIRVRVTLHDPQGRLEGGRNFEYVFHIPESADSTGS